MYSSILALAASASVALALPFEVRDVPNAAAVPDNFADPALIKDGNTWYAFSTTGQLATSTDFTKWGIVPNAKPLPHPGKWAKGDGIWAPDVIRLPNNGKFVMYYTSPSPNKPKGADQSKDYQCIGVATSDKVEGPYAPDDQPVACPLDQGGAIDSSGFVDKDGSVWMVYKIDGNSMNKPTPIMLQKMKADGKTPDGAPTQILTNDKNDGPLVEAPSIVRADDTYFLFFSSNYYNTDKYDVSYAISRNGITNGGKMYAKAHAPDAPLLKTDKRFYAPGGLDIDPDGTHVVFHADRDRKWNDHRPMWAGTVKLDAKAGTVHL